MLPAKAEVRKKNPFMVILGPDQNRKNAVLQVRRPSFSPSQAIN